MKVVLTALSAKNIHKSLAPWCLKSYCDEYGPCCDISVEEYTVNEDIADIVDDLFLKKPDAVGFSCYIWNIEHVKKIAVMLREYLPRCVIILGGPEVSFEDSTAEFPYCDYILKGAGEETLSALLKSIAGGTPPSDKIISYKNNKSFAELPSPYTKEYFDSFKKGKMLSIENQLVYYESNRGCPFSCTYCLSSTTDGVEYLPLPRVFKELAAFAAHGAKCVKFVDRTFNANKKRAKAILEYILTLDTDCTFHFEAAADLFDAQMIEIISRMPVSRVQFEIGVQSTNECTLNRIDRKTDLSVVFRYIGALAALSNCHIHVDLIAGLPFDTKDTFAQAIDECISVRPHMLQLGLLKMLKGSKLREQSEQYEYAYNKFTPYQVFKSNQMSYDDIIHFKRIESVIDKFYNSGMYKNTMGYAVDKLFKSAYCFFKELAAFLSNENLRVSLKNSYIQLLNFLLLHGDPAEVMHYIKLDCLSYDAKGMLPDEIIPQRDRERESGYRRQTGNVHKNIRAEYFDFDRRFRLFIYDTKNPFTKEYTVIELDKKDEE